MSDHETYRGISYWLETAGDNLDRRPRLNVSITADVAILGAGYTGLWTASPDRIGAITVLATLLGGEFSHGADRWRP